MVRDGNRCFDLLQAFARALNHELRTPLAVVSNDLHFFAGNDPSGVGAGSLAQCRRMSAVLRRAAALGTEPILTRSLSLEELANALGVPPPLSGAARIDADPHRLTLLGGLVRELTSHSSTTATIVSAEGAVTVRFDSTAAIPSDSLERVLAETIVTAFNGSFTTTASPHTITIELPRRHP
jgi:hypothetical protein